MQDAAHNQIISVLRKCCFSTHHDVYKSSGSDISAVATKYLITGLVQLFQKSRSIHTIYLVPSHEEAKSLLRNLCYSQMCHKDYIGQYPTSYVHLGGEKSEKCGAQIICLLPPPVLLACNRKEEVHSLLH